MGFSAYNNATPFQNVQIGQATNPLVPDKTIATTTNRYMMTSGGQLGWDGTYLYGVLNGNTLYRCNPNDTTPAFLVCAGGAEIDGTNNWDTWNAIYDGTFLYLVNLLGVVVRYDPVSDTLSSMFTIAGYGGCKSNWDLSSIIYFGQWGSANYPDGNTYARYDISTNILSQGLSLTTLAGETACIGMFAINGKVYRIAYNGGNLYLGVCTESTGPYALPFSYQVAGVASAGFNPAGIDQFAGYLISNTNVIFVENTLYNVYNISFDTGTNEISIVSNTGTITGGRGIGGVAYNYTSIGYFCDVAGNPVEANSIFNPGIQTPGFPSAPVLMYAKAVASNAGMYVSAVPTSSILAPYVQFANTPTGPWVSELQTPALLAGQQWPFYGRVYPPYGFLPAGYTFTLRLGSTP